jgi:hypothetical protein
VADDSRRALRDSQRSATNRRDDAPDEAARACIARGARPATRSRPAAVSTPGSTPGSRLQPARPLPDRAVNSRFNSWITRVGLRRLPDGAINSRINSRIAPSALATTSRPRCQLPVPLPDHTERPATTPGPSWVNSRIESSAPSGARARCRGCDVQPPTNRHDGSPTESGAEQMPRSFAAAVEYAHHSGRSCPRRSRIPLPSLRLRRLEVRLG